MRRVHSVAALILLMVLSFSVEAQMRGGGRIGGHSMSAGMRGPRGGMAFRPSPGRFPSQHMFFGPNRFGHSQRFFGPGFHHHGPFFSAGFRHRHFFFPNACFGPVINPFFCRGAFFGASFAAPIFWPDS
jgi:hypothetical protein